MPYELTTKLAGCSFRQLDFTVEYQTQSADDSVLFLKIHSTARALKVSFVYVRGLLQVSDTLWKWCAEFTQRHPWVFIVFEDTDTSWLLPENVDRCIDEASAGPGRRHGTSVVADAASLGTILQPVTYPDIGAPVMKTDFHLEDTLPEVRWDTELDDMLFQRVSTVRTAHTCTSKLVGYSRCPPHLHRPRPLWW